MEAKERDFKKSVSFSFSSFNNLNWDQLIDFGSGSIYLFTYYLLFIVKIKKCGEMARKLRFFKEQMEKAGVSPSSKPLTQTDIDMDGLEVCQVDYATRLCFWLSCSNFIFYLGVLVKTWRT